MPLLEVVYAREEPLPVEQRRAFAREAVEIFREVLGTPPGRLRLAFYYLEPEDSLGLLDEPRPEARAERDDEPTG
jgi:phenylpyruvate tautomerase PptA (4-oxalocrotonate tautomerase family)